MLEQTSRVLSTWKWQAVFKVGVQYEEMGEVPPRHSLSRLPSLLLASRQILGKQVQKNNVGSISRTDVKATAEKRETLHILIDHI